MRVFAFSLTSASLPETPSDCVRQSLTIVQNVANDFGDDLNGEFHDFYMAEYMDMYEDCVNSL